MKIVRIDRVEVVGPHSLRLTFDDGLLKTVDVSPLLRGPVFEPLLEPGYFERGLLEPTAGTVVWPNGADFAPEALRALPAEKDRSGGRPTCCSDVARVAVLAGASTAALAPGYFDAPLGAMRFAVEKRNAVSEAGHSDS